MKAEHTCHHCVPLFHWWKIRRQLVAVKMGYDIIQRRYIAVGKKPI